MIEHEGTIVNINGCRYTVRIIQKTACSECHAKDVCISSDAKEKMIDVVDNMGKFEINERVLLYGKTSIGYRAILWAFILPLILIISVILVSTSFEQPSELQVALIALLVLVPYYILLYVLRNRMSKKMAFTIKKLN